MSSTQRNEMHGNLRLDRILASQPELGPSIPDGGYGWIILVATLIIQVLVPSVLVSYGIFMLFLKLEGPNFNDNPKLWDIKLLTTPVVFIAFWSLSDPLSRNIVANSTWPRLVSTSGICILCAGLLFQWIAITHMKGTAVYVLAGIFSGCGASLTTIQSEILIKQYFKLKLPMVNNLLVSAYSLGFIITPIILGFIIASNGILRGLIIYQAILLQMIIVVMVYKKPDYLKSSRRPYELLQNISEDDDMIFANDQTELPTYNNQTDEVIASSSNSTPNENKKVVKQTNLLSESFAAEFSQDLGHSQQLNNTPTPLFIEVDMPNNNSTYSFDNNVVSKTDNHVTSLFTSPRQPSDENFFRCQTRLLSKLSFYKCLLLLSTMKYSALILWVLFPTYIYVEMEELKVQQTTFLVGCLGLGSLFIGIFSSFLPVSGSKRQTTISVFCFIGAAGYFVISDAGTEGWFLFGALLVTLSVTIFHVLQSSVIKHILEEDSEKAQSLLSTLVAFAVLLLFIFGPSYRNCIRLMSLLQFITGSVLLTSYFYKKIKRLFTHNH